MQRNKIQERCEGSSRRVCERVFLREYVRLEEIKRVKSEESFAGGREEGLRKGGSKGGLESGHKRRDTITREMRGYIGNGRGRDVSGAKEGRGRQGGGREVARGLEE